MLFYGVWIWLLARDPKCWRFLDTRIVEDFHGSVFFFDCTLQRIWKLWELERLLRTSGVVQMSSYTSKIVPWSWWKPIRYTIIEYGKAYHTHTSDVSDTLQKSNMANIRHPPENMAMENHQVFNKEIWYIYIYTLFHSCFSMFFHFHVFFWVLD